MKKKKIWKVVVPAAIAAIVIVMLVYLMTGNHAATAEARAAIESTDTVRVSENDQEIVFAPDDNSEKSGLVFYPGGKVDADAYAQFAHEMADEGVLCVIVKMPFDLAVFNSGGAKAVLDAHPEIETWYLSGHSLGGVMAADYAMKDSRVEGVAFLASYPNSDLSGSGLRALSITASNDGVLDRAKYEQARPNFPADTILFEIEGGNHAGFGNYGVQDKDNEASIPPAEQQITTARQIAEWIKQ